MAALRKLVLQITWDGQAQAGRLVPAGRLLRHRPGREPLQVARHRHDRRRLLRLLVHAVCARAPWSNWSTRTTATAQVEFEIVHAPLARPFDGLGHFHCKWHRDTFPLPEDRWPDWAMLRTAGPRPVLRRDAARVEPARRLVGRGRREVLRRRREVPLHLRHRLGGLLRLRLVRSGPFQRPFHGQTMTENNKGHQSVLRWHVVDNVPFQKSFEGCIEKYYPEREAARSTPACLLVPGPRRQRSLRAGARSTSGTATTCSPPLGGGGFKVLGQAAGQRPDPGDGATSAQR